MAVQDYKYGEICDLLYVPLLCFVKIKMLYLILFIALILNYKHLEKYIGGADIKLIILFFLLYNETYVFSWLFLSFCCAILYALLNRKKNIRMFPFFFISHASLFLCR